MQAPTTNTAPVSLYSLESVPASRLVRMVVAASAILLIGMWGTLVIDLRHERQIHVGQAQRDNENLSIAFQHHVESTITSIDAMLLFMRHEFLENLQHARQHNLVEWAHQGPLQDSIVQIGIIDPRGYLVFTSANPKAKPTYVGDRDHFRAHEQTTDDKLYVGKAIRIQTADVDAIPFSPRIATADGRFLGVVSVLVRPEHFSNFYQSILLGEQGAVTLVRDGVVLARSSGAPPPANPIGIDVSGILPDPSATTDNRVVISPVDGLTRMIHFRRVKDQPLAVIVSQTEKDYLAQYAHTQSFRLIIGLMTSLGIVVLALLLIRLARRLDSERQKAATSEFRLRSIVENINVATWEFDIASDRYTYVSPQIETMFGYPVGAWLLQNCWRQHLHEADRDQVVAYCNAKAGQGADHEVAYRFVKHDGSVAWVRDIVKVLNDENGKPARLAGVFIDFTAPKEAAIALANQQALLRTLIDSVPDLIFFKDANGAYIGCNKAFTEFTGRAESEHIGKTDFDFFDHDSAELFRMNDREMLALGRARRNEEWVTYPDGREVLLDTLKAPIIGAQGESLGLIGISRDITESIRAEEGLLLARSVFETTGEAIMVTDAEGRILMVNPAFSTITGWNAADAIGNTASILKSGRYPPEFYAGMWNALRDSGHWEGEIWNRRKSGEIYAQWVKMNAICDSRGQVKRYVSLFSDITQRKTEEEKVWHQANFDSLTGLANRNLFHDRLERSMARARRDQRQLGLMFIDLDRFKWINDTLGHAAGDNLLVETAARLQSCVREEDTVARLGGDEFAIVLQGHPDHDTLQIVADKILAALASPYALGGTPLTISGSVGIAIFPNHGDDAGSLLRNADSAMYQAKAAGRNRCRFFSPEMQAEAPTRIGLNAI